MGSTPNSPSASSAGSAGGSRQAPAVRIGINGVAGRMGRQLVSAVSERENCQLGVGLEVNGSPAVGTDARLLGALPDSSSTAGDSPILVTDDLQSVSGEVDVFVDFSRPDGTMALLDTLMASGHGALVIGTTGFSASEKQSIEKAATRLPLVMASNYSVGVTLCLELLKTTAAALGDDYDVEVIEAHHRNKIDAPSGTALSMGEAVANALGRDLDTCAVYGREGNTGVRSRTEIGFETIRAGDIIGDHTVLFAGDGERIEITHRATDRMAFARGAIRAAEWLAGQPAGLYDMSDVIGLGKRV